MRLGRRTNGLVRAVAAAGVAAVSLVPTAWAQGADPVCDRFGAGAVAGTVKNAAITEISGLVASRLHPGVYWTHNDSGGQPEFFALRLDGGDLGRFALQGAAASDWEAIAVGPKFGATGSYLYAGDIGDNAAAVPFGASGQPRNHVSIYRAPEPSATPVAPGRTLGPVERFDLVYPEGPEDAEALLVDPVSGDLVIVTKSVLGRSRVLSAPANKLTSGATVTMVDHGMIQIVPKVGAGVLPGTFVTGADVSADGSLVLLRTYRAVLAFERTPGESVPAALSRPGCDAPQSEETQGEAIAIAADGSRYVTIGEGTAQPVNVFAITPPLGQAAGAPPTTATPPARVAGETLIRTGAAQGTALVVAAAVTAGVLVSRGRRRAR